MDKLKVLAEIKGFLEGYNNDLKYITNVETDPRTNIANCVIHEPNKEPRIENIKYEPFLYTKDLSKVKKLYEGQSEQYIESKKIKYGITITPLKTGNQKRLVEGYCFKITSSRSHNDIMNYLKDGGIDPYEKLTEDDGKTIIKDKKGEPIYLYRDCFYSPRTTEQFFISTQTRLYKGYEEYKKKVKYRLLKYLW